MPDDPARARGLVVIWQPAKWTARLRERKTDANPLLLKVCAGRAGGGGREGEGGGVRVKGCGWGGRWAGRLAGGRARRCNHCTLHRGC
jgi:hypothetical protein